MELETAWSQDVPALALSRVNESCQLTAFPAQTRGLVVFWITEEARVVLLDHESSFSMVGTDMRPCKEKHWQCLVWHHTLVGSTSDAIGHAGGST